MELTLEAIERIARCVPGEVAVYRLDGGLFRLYASEGVIELTGHTLDNFNEIRDADAFDVVAPSDRSRIIAEVVRSQETDGDFDVTYQVLNREQGFVWVHARGRTIGEMDGKPILLVTIVNSGNENAPQVAVIENSERPIYIIDRHTFELLYMNAACERIYGKTPTFGQRCYDYKFGYDFPCPWCKVPGMEDTATLSDFFSERLGKWFQYDYRAIDWFGHDAVVVYGFDITSRLDEQVELRNSLEREERLVGYIQTINGPGPLAGRLDKVLESIGGHLEADRAYICEIHGDITSNTYEWCAEGITHEMDELQAVDVSAIDRWRPYLDNGRCVIVSDIEGIRESAPFEYRIMSSQGIGSYVEAPLLADGVLIGFIGVDNPTPGNLERSADTLLSFAYYVSSALVRADGERKLEESQHRFELAIEGAELGVWTYDISTRTINSPSNSFAKFGVTGPIENIPQSLFPMLDEEEQEKLVDFYRRVDAGEPKITGDFWMRWRPNMPRRCERVVYTIERDDEGKPTVAYGIGMNYTAQKLEQENYEHTMRQILTIDSDTLCAYRLNLTRGICDFVYGTESYPGDLSRVEGVDDLIDRVKTHLASVEDRERFSAVMNRRELTGRFNAGTTEVSETYRRVASDGTTRWTTIHVNMMQNPQTSNIVAAVSVKDGDDDTVRTRMLEILAEEDYDHISVIYPYDQTVRIYFYNPDEPTKLSAEQKAVLLDYAFASEKAASGWIHPDCADAFRLNCSLGNIMDHLSEAHAYSFEVDALAKDGGIRRKLLIYTYLDEAHERIMEVQRDITDIYREQQRALDLAKEEALRTRDIMDSISTGVSVLRMPDPYHLMVDYVNLQMYRLMGFDADDDESREAIEAEPLIQAYFRDAFFGIHPEDVERIRRIYQENFDSKRFDTGFYRIIGAKGTYIWVDQEVELREITSRDRVLYTTYRKVDEEVRLEGELERQLEEEVRLRQQADAANEAKSSFLSSVSHDMRTPLNAVLGYTSIARDSRDMDRIQDYLAKVEQSGKVLQQLIDDTLDLNKISTGMTSLRPEPVAAYEIFDDIETAIRPSLAKKDIRFVTDFDGSPMATILVDKVRVREVFLNLLNNSVKFTPRGGTIMLSVRRESTDADIAHEVIVVTDTGCGMSPEFLPTVFEPFAQERTDVNQDIEGSGLGLAIVKGLIDQMGGRIEVESDLGEGSTFTVYLDFKLVPKHDDERDLEESARLTTLRGRRVLLVEDNSMNTEIAKVLLEHEGVEVDCAVDGKEGLDRFRASQLGEYDAICMDVRMPVMDGLEATRAIRALDRSDARHVPIVAMTANAYDEDVKQCLEAGMDAHISKPIDPKNLFTTLARAIGERH